MPLAGAEALGLALPPRPHTQSPRAWLCQRLGSGYRLLLPPHPSDNTTPAEASGVPGGRAERPAAGGHPEEGWQPAGAQLGAWGRLSP